MDINRGMDNWILISIKHGYPFMDIYCSRISIAECPCMDIAAWISMWISTLVWIIEDWHPKIMDINVDIRGFSEINVWICYGFSDQGQEVPKDFLWSGRATGPRRVFLVHLPSVPTLANQGKISGSHCGPPTDLTAYRQHGTHGHCDTSVPLITRFSKLSKPFRSASRTLTYALHSRCTGVDGLCQQRNPA